MDMVKPLWAGWHHPVLPAVFDDSLSYYEVVAKLTCKVNELIGLVQDMVTWDELDPVLDAIRESVSKVAADIAAEAEARAEADSKLADGILGLKSYFDADQQRQTQELELYCDMAVSAAKLALMKYSDTGDDAVRAYADMLAAELQSQIDELKDLFGLVWNPTKGRREPASDVVEDIYDWDRYAGFPAALYDATKLTAQGYDSAGLSAREYDVWGRLRLRFDFRTGGHSPFTGEPASDYELALSLADLHKADWDAQGYDAKEYTAEQYDGFEWSAYDADWKNYTVLA